MTDMPTPSPYQVHTSAAEQVEATARNAIPS